MKNIREIITDLNVARSNSCSQEKSEEIKGIIQNLLPYAEIEENIGINLNTLVKALNNPIAIKLDNGNIVTMWCSNRLYGAGIGDYFLAVDDHILHFEDYGKTWALTKEELL